MNPAVNTPARATPALVAQTSAAAPAAAASAPLTLQDVPPAGAAPVDTSVPATSPGGTAIGNIEIVHPSADSPAPNSTVFPGTQAAPAPANADPPQAAAPPQAATPAAAVNGGIAPVGPANTTLAPIEKPDAAPAAINEAAGTKQPAAQLPPANGQKAKVDCDKSDESCSRHKKKKGLAKLNPF